MSAYVSYLRDSYLVLLASAGFHLQRLSRTVKPSCISTVLLKASQPLHTPPIKLVVFQRTYQATL